MAMWSAHACPRGWASAKRIGTKTSAASVLFVSSLTRHGVIAIAAAISPYRAIRDELRASIPNFVEIHVTCPMEILIERDVKGLYKKAMAGEIAQFTGITDPYEPPLRPELTVDSSRESPEESCQRVWQTLESLGLISFGRST